MAVGTIALVCFIFLTSSPPPTSTYEISIYSAYHPLTWIAFTTALICYFSLLLSKHYRIQAVIGVAILYFIFLSIPLFRGYVFFATPRSDLLYHYGIVKDVIETGTVISIFYPATHITSSTIILVTDISYSALQSIISIMFTTVLIMGLVITGRRLSERNAGPYFLLAALPLIYSQSHLSVQPWFFALTLVPLLVFTTVIYSPTSQQLAGAGLGLAGALIIYHPLTAIFGFIAIAITIISKEYISRATIRLAVQHSIYPLIPAVVLVYWILYFDRVQRSILLFTQGDFDQQGTITYAGQAAEAGKPLWQLIWEFLILQWGTVIIYMGLASLLIIVVFVRYRQNRATAGELIVGLIFVAGVLFSLVFLLLDLFARNPIRVSQFGLVVTPLLIGMAFRLAFKQSNFDIRISQTGFMTIVSVILFILVLLTALLAAGTLYEDNRHLTEKTLEGTGWHLDYHDRSQPTYSQRMAFNLELYYHGYTMAYQNKRVFNRYDPDQQLPNRLGYESSTNVGEWAGNGYLITKRDDVAWASSRSQNQPIAANHYTEDDVQRLESDSTAQAVYENGAYRIWTTRPPN